jgi:hypothetical protein
MYKEDPEEAGVAIDAQEWWTKLLEKQKEKADLHPSDVELTVTFLRYETWCLTWFSHYTFDDGRSDVDFIRSFEKFVGRMECLNERARYKHGRDTDAYCLMGAEDRFRWTARAKGTGIVGCGETTGEPPCRCEGCKAAGVVRIDH